VHGFRCELAQKQRGAREDSHHGQKMTWRAVVAAHGGGAAPSGSDDGDGLLWCTSSSKKTSGGFTAGSSTSSQPAITASGSGKWCVTAVARVQRIAEQNPNDLGLYL
jgi:hypothetical protein